jgi:23S rRNA pseudouridine1911/1915/1917 synthase
MLLNRGYRYRQVLGPEAAGHTVHSYLVGAFAHSTADQWRSRLEAGEILVNDRLAGWREPVRPGQILIWNRPGWVEERTPETYGVVYRDESLLVVDKPSGLPTLPGGGFYAGTLLERVRTDFPEARPLHRLGRGTSGLVLFALDRRAASALQRGWYQVRKRYLALGSGVAAQDEYEVTCPIGPVPHPRLGQVHAASPNGKHARSRAWVRGRGTDSTIFEVELGTGRPHQIRIHLASIGHPLVGDPLYAAGGTPKAERPGLPGDLGYSLHAWRLGFTHPVTGELMALEAEPPSAGHFRGFFPVPGSARP